MDLSSIIGILLGIAAIVGGNFLEGSGLTSILQPTAALIVFGGTLGAVLLSYPMRTVRMAATSLRDAFTENPRNMNKVIAEIVSLSYKARKEGIIALEDNASRTREPFLRRALTMAIDGTDSKLLRDSMEIEMDNLESEMEQPARVWETAGGISPTIGILGAVLGLIHVMQNLTDPSKIGSGIAVAFVATVYGVGVANLVFIPIANKLKNRARERMLYYEAILEGILAIQSGDNPRMIEEKLKGFLTSTDKKGYVAQTDRVRPGVRVA